MSATDFQRGMEAQRREFQAMMQELIASKRSRITQLEVQLERVKLEIADLQAMQAAQPQDGKSEP